MLKDSKDQVPRNVSCCIYRILIGRNIKFRFPSASDC